MAGALHKPAIIRRMNQLQKIVCDCDQSSKVGARSPSGKINKRTCRQLGDLKHKCCEAAIRDSTRKGSKSGIQGETGYSAKGTPPKILSCKRGPGAPRDSSWPDAIITDGSNPPNPLKIVDFKFQCPKGSPLDKEGKKVSSGTRKQDWTTYPESKGSKFSNQLEKYRDLTKRLGLDPNDDDHAPELVTNEACPASNHCKKLVTDKA